ACAPGDADRKSWISARISSNAGSPDSGIWFIESTGSKRALRMPAATKRPSSNGTRTSPRQCSTSAGHATPASHDDASSAANASIRRCACSGVQDRRCRSLNASECSRLELGKNCVVTIWRKAALSWPQPASTRRAMAANVSRWAAPGWRTSTPRAKAPSRTRWLTRSGWRAAYAIVQRDRGDVAVRQAAAARVVTVETMARAQGLEPRTPHGGLPVPLQVRHPVGGPNQRKALSALGKSDLHAVRGGGEADLLAKGRHAASLVPATANFHATSGLQFD